MTLIHSRLFISAFTVIFLSVAVSRLLLVTPDSIGFYPDESRYAVLLQGAQTSLSQKSLVPYIVAIFSIEARPGYGILYVLPTLISANGGTITAGMYLNVFVSVGICMLLYLITQNLSKRPWVGLLSSSLFALSMTSTTYLRHMLPYDGALFVFLLGIYLYLKTKSPMLFGSFMSLAFATHPGIYYEIVPLPVLLFLIQKKKTLFKRLEYVAMFFLGFGLVSIGFELVSRIVGAPDSYLTTASNLSVTITQGDFVPTIAFLSEYVLVNDGWFGILMISVSITLSVILLRRKKSPRVILLLVVYCILLYLFLEYSSFLTKKTVLYGRTVRPLYLSLFVLFSINMGELLGKSPSRFTIACMFVISFGFLSWYPRFLEYKQIVYPKTLQTLAETKLHPKTLHETYTTGDSIPPALSPGHYMVNPAFLYPYLGNLQSINCAYDVVLSTQHPFASYKPYVYEGYSRVMREKISNDPPLYQVIYCKSI